MPSALWKGSKVLGLGGETLGQSAKVLIPDTLFIICVALAKSCQFSVPQFPHMFMRMITEAAS